MRDKRIVLFCRNAGQRLEPMCVMSRAVCDSPVLHRFRNHIRRRHGKLAALIHDFFDFLIDVLRQYCFHFSKCKDVRCKNFFHIHYFTHNAPPFPLQKQKMPQNCFWNIIVQVPVCTKASFAKQSSAFSRPLLRNHFHFHNHTLK